MRQRIIEAWASYLDLEAARERACDEFLQAFRREAERDPELRSKGNTVADEPESLKPYRSKLDHAIREVSVQYGLVTGLLAFRVCRLPSGAFLMPHDEEGILEVEEVI